VAFSFSCVFCGFTSLGRIWVRLGIVLLLFLVMTQMVDSYDIWLKVGIEKANNQVYGGAMLWKSGADSSWLGKFIILIGGVRQGLVLLLPLVLFINVEARRNASRFIGNLD
jgi:hypothetical protein